MIIPSHFFEIEMQRALPLLGHMWSSDWHERYAVLKIMINHLENHFENYFENHFENHFRIYSNELIISYSMSLPHQPRPDSRQSFRIRKYQFRFNSMLWFVHFNTLSHLQWRGIQKVWLNTYWPHANWLLLHWGAGHDWCSSSPPSQSLW